MPDFVLTLLVLAFGLLWGIREGIAMIHPGNTRSVYPRLADADPYLLGPRSHQWFRGYHAVNVALVILVAIVARYADPGQGRTLAAAGVLAWRLAEIAYALARYARAVPAVENVLGAGLHVGRRGIIALDCIAVVVAIVLVNA